MSAISSSTPPSGLKKLLLSPDLEFLMEAHNGLSAKIVEETGFKGIWASGLAISASLGLRDCNEASWTQVLDVVEFMSDSTSLPILLDGDSGFGDFNIVRRLILKLEHRGVGGVCLEDKLYPKRNSFIDGDQIVCDADLFTGKIMAAKDTQKDENFCVVARLEGFIVGLPFEQVMERAHMYADAGADAILVHSKKSDAEEILTFTSAWDRPTPLVIVPTTYNETPTEVFADAGVSLAIWANHNLRSSITAMQETSRQIFEAQSTSKAAEKIASVKEIFRLQDMDELAEAEKKYISTNN